MGVGLKIKDEVVVENSFELNEHFLSELYDELFPIHRSIAGPGFKQSLEIFKRYMPLEITQIPTGTEVFDWEVPPEWHIHSAILRGPDGEVICDIKDSNLHVLSYSESVDQKLSLEELKEHLYTLPDLPDAIPYVTSYYVRKWGFCIPHRQLESLKEGTYHAKIDAEFVEGSVDFGVCRIEGQSLKTVLLSSYLCHPSLANNELSGPLVLLGLYDRISKWKKRRFTYEFLLNPETIGSLCYLYKNGNELKADMHAGLVLTCLGGPQQRLSYAKSREGQSLLDQLAESKRQDLDIREFTPLSGSDERQYCSPGFNLPVGQMARSIYLQHKEYHNSLDDKEFMDIKQILKSIDEIEELLYLHDSAGYYLNQKPKGEPHLSKYNLYPTTNFATTRHNLDKRYSDPNPKTFLNKVLMILNYSDGKNSLLDIAKKSSYSLEELIPVAESLETAGLLKHQN